MTPCWLSKLGGCWTGRTVFVLEYCWGDTTKVSPTWKAIVKGREVLKLGLVRRIGDGRTTEIWHDRWIDGAVGMKPLGRCSDNPVQLVSDLLDEDSNQWDVDKVKSIFFPIDVEAILSMPRPRSSQPDFWAWAWDRTGMFTVRSAYKELAHRSNVAFSNAGSSHDEEGMRKSLWKLQVMPKIRVFWWRVVKGLLPFAAELKRRHISFCPLCGHDNETLYHALVECEHAKLFWRSAHEFFEIKLPRLHPDTWARDILHGDMVNKKDAAIAVTVMWTIWGSRNSYSHEEVKYQPLKSMELVDELIKSMEVPCSEVVGPAAEVQKWSRPASGWIKVNVDGALNHDTHVAGAGVVARDDAGNFIAAECRKYDHIIDPAVVETLACRDAVLLAHRLGWTHVVLETDCQSIVSAWEGGKEQRSACCHVLQEMKDVVSNFQGFVFTFVRRDANKAAHACARNALSIVPSVMYFELVPGCLSEIVQADLMSSME